MNQEMTSPQNKVPCEAVWRRASSPHNIALTLNSKTPFFILSGASTRPNIPFFFGWRARHRLNFTTFAFRRPEAFRVRPAIREKSIISEYVQRSTKRFVRPRPGQHRERFGYYTMLAIFVLFLQAKFGFDTTVSGQIYAIFLAEYISCLCSEAI